MVSAWAVGTIINLVGSIVINLGTNVMKLGHNKRALKSASNRTPIRFCRTWQLGIFLFAIGNLLNFTSFGFAAQSLLAALGSVQFVANAIFASIVLGEKITREIILATGCITTGCIILVCFANHESLIYDVNDMMQLYCNYTYVLFITILLVASGFLYFFFYIGQQKLLWLGRDLSGEKWVNFLPVAYALFSGAIGTQSVLFCKTLSILLRTTLMGNSQLQSWFFWSAFFAFILTAFFWISKLNLALQLFPATIIVPLMQISWTLFSILSGGIYFQDYQTMNYTQVAIFLGVYLLAFDNKLTALQKNDIEINYIKSQTLQNANDSFSFQNDLSATDTVSLLAK